MIINLTQHPGTPEQGVTDLTGEARERLIELLTFDAIPSRVDILTRAYGIATLGAVMPFADAAMIGGAPYLMAPLEAALRLWGIRPLYAFSLRESVEETMPDGTVKKTAIFRHKGFVEA
jgi:hypothetical protein